MIYITGDIHGDLNRFNHRFFKLFGKIKKRDTLIICGDFGFIWDGSKKEQRILKWLGKRRFDVLFVDGVHENFDELEKYETEDWNGGKTRKISGKLRQLMRGYVFEIGEKKVLAFGGGQSDQSQSGKHNPSEEDFSRAEESLAKHDYNIDYIVSYEPPTQIAEFLNLGRSQHDSDIISYYLDEINRRTDYERWFFGKHHINKIVTSKYFAMFDNIVNADYDPITKK
jgi:Icc-related predicted phosphoesterase